ncbi:MAG: hypothetical protein ACI4UE_02940 [Candidatus Scatovivens sp.]
MSIKAQLASLRKRQEELKKLIKNFSYELANEKSQQKSITHDVEQLSQRKSELAVKLCQEQRQKLEARTQKVNELRATIEHYEEEYFSNLKTIKSYLEDTSFYINEQVSFLVQAFLDYVIKYESEVGKNMTSKFSIAECKDTYHCRGAGFGGFVQIPNGNFVIKFNEDVILQSKDYYFERAIAIKGYDDVLKQETITIADWYAPYAKNFKKAFMDTLAEKFKSKNFALTFTGDSFTLDLI